MYTRIVLSRFVVGAVLAFASGMMATPAWSQAPPSPPSAQHQHPATPEQKPTEQEMQMARDGSGTAWLPDTTPMYAIHWQRGRWQLMAHGNAFVQFLSDSGDRGDDQFGSINWFMGMAERNVGRGRLQLRGMFSLEPATVPGCGYPDLLASGEQCNGEPIHDRQHQHDLLMEIAARYDAPLKGSMRWQVYGAPAGEPALGPVAYPHRVSAMPNPLAPIAHHWLDATHITFGVITAGVYANRWKAEASVFNGREPDETRTNLDFAPLDSASGRFWFLPTPQWAFQFSAGKLNEAEPSEGGGPGIDVTRATASGTYHRAFRENSIWATTFAWGLNAEPDHASNAVLVEMNLTLDDRDSWFSRFEIVGKTAHDLGIEASSESFTVAKLQGGFTRYFESWKGLRPGIGGSISAGFVPEGLKSTYGSRVNMGVGVFLTLRPAAMTMHAGHTGATPTVGSSQAPAVDHSQHTKQPSEPPPPGATKPPEPGPADPHAGHAMPKPAPPPDITVPTAKPPAVADPHAGHQGPATKPGTEPGTPPAAAATKPKPGATAAPHAGHQMPPAPKGTTAPKTTTTKPPAKVADPHAGHTEAPQTKKEMDPVNGLMVDPVTAPKTTHQGRTYYFSSEQSLKQFLENPAKFAKPPKK
jgi:YHS domain-containing protein